MDWSRFIVLAEELAQREDEAAKRTAISRAYYATFNRARRLLEAEGVSVADHGRAHADVWRTLEAAGRARRRLGQDGKRLKHARLRADYDDRFDDLDQQVRYVLGLARSLGTLLDRA